MSQTSVNENVEGDVATETIIPVNTPLYQANGGQKYKLNIETTAGQVKMPDGIDVATRITTLERGLAANATSHIVDTIEERDALKNLIVGDKVTVLDATGDETVEKGGATYIYMKDFTFRKLAEDEAMDHICDWEHIKNKPESPAKDIDTAVIKQHTHANKTILDLLGDDGSNQATNAPGNLTYNGKLIWDGKRDIVSMNEGDTIPANLRDGGLIVINPAAVTGESA